MKYYQNMREKREFKIDHLKLQEYFTLDHVIEGVFKIFQLILNLEFKEIKNQPFS